MATSVEHEAFLWLQGRMVELLLRHDVSEFKHRFAERLGVLFEDERYELLRPYRELAVLFYLRDELLESILPRIKRRLSFLAPREILMEALPPRGRIDWPRTLTAGLRDRPGEPPLEVHTRQRRRHFATPENLLTVITLLEYRARVQRRLDAEREQPERAWLRHPLREIIERCTRELAFPQFIGLVRTCEQIIMGDTQQVPGDLERAVEAQLMPGRNSAYDDLLAWRRRLAALRLLDRRDGTRESAMLGADPARDNYLYQLWLFYELGDLLKRGRKIDHWEPGSSAIFFHWGEDGDTRQYVLTHDLEIDCHWDKAPGVRPDLYITRVDRRSIYDKRNPANEQLVWRDYGYVLDAKYYKPRGSRRAPGDSVKRMLADLHLTGERHGALLFAFQRDEQRQPDEEPASEPDANLLVQLTDPLYSVRPQAAAAQTSTPDVSVDVWRVRPHITEAQATRAILAGLIEHVHQALRERVEIRCHGVFLDGLSAAERSGLQSREKTDLVDKPAHSTELIVCPKPHLGPWRVDLVRRDIHCLKDPQLCHIIGQMEAHAPVRPPRSARELLSELDRLFAVGDLEALDEAAIEYAVSRIEGLTRRFAEVTGALQNLGRYEAKLGDIGLDRTLPLIGSTERESLALAIYLRDQLDEVQANDYSASIIHVARVLERELQRRILAIPGITGADFPHGKPTLGALGGVSRKNPELWGRISAHLAQVWVGQVDPADAAFVVSIEQLINEIEILVRARNQAAHTTPIARNRFRDLLRALCSSGPLRVGALNVLLLAWPHTASSSSDNPGGMGQA